MVITAFQHAISGLHARVSRNAIRIRVEVEFKSLKGDAFMESNTHANVFVNNS